MVAGMSCLSVHLVLRHLRCGCLTYITNLCKQSVGENMRKPTCIFVTLMRFVMFGDILQDIVFFFFFFSLHCIVCIWLLQWFDMNANVCSLACSQHNNANMCLSYSRIPPHLFQRWIKEVNFCNFQKQHPLPPREGGKVWTFLSRKYFFYFSCEQSKHHECLPGKTLPIFKQYHVSLFTVMTSLSGFILNTFDFQHSSTRHAN